MSLKFWLSKTGQEAMMQGRSLTLCMTITQRPCWDRSIGRLREAY